MRFSLRTMTSGARNSISFFRRLLRLMTRRYKIVQIRRRETSAIERHERAQARVESPESHRESSISGRFPDFRKLVATFSRFEYFSFFCCEVSSFIRLRRSVASSSTSTIAKQFLDRFGAHLGDELCRIVAHELAIALIGDQFTFFQSGNITRIDNDVGFEIEDLLQLA